MKPISIHSIRTLCSAVVLMLALPFASPVTAAFPEKPVRLIVPYPAGGTIDAIMRAIQEKVQQNLGRPLIIENKPGAAGITGMQEVARAAPDGYTIGQVNSGMVITPVIQPSVGSFDMARDFAPITMLSNGPLVLFTHPRVPGNDVASFLAFAKSRPQGLNYSSTGMGGAGHLSAELISQLTGVKFVHIPYKGNAPAMLAVLQGEVDFLISTVSDTALQNVQAKKLKILGVTTREATPVVPGVPPIGATVPGFEAPIWIALVAPRNTPADVIAVLNKAFTTVLADPETRKRYETLGLVATPSAPGVVTTAIQKELDTWLPIVRSRNIVAN